MNKSFVDTYIDDKELKIELKILQLIEKQDGMVVVVLAVVSGDRFHIILTPKYLLYHSSKKTINKRTIYPTISTSFLTSFL